MGHINRLTILLAPYIFGEIRIVDKGVTVTLRSLDSIVTVYLLLRNRVLTMPLEQEHHAVFSERKMGRIEIFEDHSAATGSDRIRGIAVFSDHTEVSASKIAFVLFFGFKDRTATRSGRTEKGVAIGRDR